ncbi:MAG: serine hydrolase domain-containing protein, partial [Gemmatimonadota bacterium]
MPELAAFDQIFPALMKTWKIPGGAVAVTYQGRLVYARGYGYADTLAKTPVEPDALFRIASVSKPITAVAMLKLAEQGKVDLGAKAFALVPDLAPLPGATVDPRIADITVSELLWHTAGWDRDLSGDPIFLNATIAQEMGVPAPTSIENIIRYMLGRQLDFTPGARWAYSNFGYSVLGRIIERASGERYDAYVKSAVLGPAGITRMQLGHSRIAERAPGEVRYYDLASTGSLFPGDGAVSFPDGGFYLESMDSHGGWIASAVDLVRFLTAVDGAATRPDVISDASRTTMLAPPPNVWAGLDYHYGMGWLVRPNPGNWWHDGSLPGTSAFVARLAGGVTIALLFNAREMTPGSLFAGQIDPKMSEALGQV